MTKVKLFRFGFWGLLCFNIILIGLLIIGRPPHPFHKEKPRDIIVQKLGLDKQQQLAFEQLITDHQKKIHSIEEERRLLKETLFLNFDTQQANNEILLQKLGTLQQKIETAHIQHFLEIKNLCKEEQLPKFDALKIELAKMFRPHPPKK